MAASSTSASTSWRTRPDPSDRNPSTSAVIWRRSSRAAVVDQFEAGYLDALLARTGGNVSAAARLAQMTRSHLNELLAKHDKTGKG